MNKHYDIEYYNWQRKLGLWGGVIDSFKFKDVISKSDLVLDFGCGGGYILEKFKAKGKYGVEINDIAAKDAKNNGVIVYKSIDTIPRELIFDVIISHHALEHVDDPTNTLRSLHKHLKKNGKLVLVIPMDDWRTQKKFNSQDINQHLFAWTPLIIGNLLTHSGYQITKIEILSHAWIPFSGFFYEIIPKWLYYFGCKVWSVLTLNRQIRVIAIKK